MFITSRESAIFVFTPELSGFPLDLSRSPVLRQSRESSLVSKYIRGYFGVLSISQPLPKAGSVDVPFLLGFMGFFWMLPKMDLQQHNAYCG
jgi:hypothetical protein